LSWTFDEIDGKYLVGQRLALPADEVVAAFNRAEEILGTDWIGANYAPEGARVIGARPTLEVVTVGQQLRALENVPRADNLVAAILRGERYSFAELEALHLLRNNHEDFQAEMYPPDPTGTDRVADFRIRKQDDRWLYVEVTQPHDSEDERRLRKKTNELKELVERLGGSFALEIIMRREPTDKELLQTKDFLSQFCKLNPPQRAELPNGLGVLVLSRRQTGPYKFKGFQDEDTGPGLFELHTKFDSKTSSRQIAILLAFADDRAEAVLRREARQLPKLEPGLVMANMSSAPGGLKAWEPLLLHRFQPTQHTRVTAVFMWAPGFGPSDHGLTRKLHTRLVINPHSVHSLPSWARSALRGDH